jgi:phosphoglycolate phosphatase
MSKPDPGHLLGVIAAAGGDPERALMVGDSAVASWAAQGAGVPSILVSFGYCPPPPEGPQANSVIDHFDMLETCALPLLKGLTAKAAAPS